MIFDSLEIYAHYVNQEGVSEDAAGQLVVADALRSIVKVLNKLGTNEAATQMGGLEIVANEIRTGLQDIAGRIGNESSCRDSRTKSKEE